MEPKPAIWEGTLPHLATIDCSHRVNPEFVDYTGQRFKDITVIGLMHPMYSGVAAGWLCRCVCGNHFTRKAKSLKLMARNSNSPRYCCDICYNEWVAEVEQSTVEN